MARAVYGKVGKAMLKVLRVSGEMAFNAFAPRTSRWLKLMPEWRPIYEQKRQVSGALKRLETADMVRVFTSNGKQRVELTPDGQSLADRLAAEELILNQPKKWDDLWRLVMFDVRENRKRLRDRLRKWLKSNGFIRLQDSVWIYPYECEEVVELIRSALRMRGEVIYLTCKRFPSDRWLAYHFRLPKKSKK